MSGRYYGPFSTYFSIFMTTFVALYEIPLLIASGPPRNNVQVSNLESLAVSALLFSLSTGISSMILIEIAKRLFWLRSSYQRVHVSIWFNARSNQTEYVRSPERIHTSEDHPKEGVLDAFHYLVTANPIYRRIDSNAEHRRDVKVSPRRRRGSMRQVYNLPIEQVCAQLSLAADQALEQPESNLNFLIALTGDAELVLALLDERAHEVQDENHDYASRLQVLISQRIRAGIDDLQISVGQNWQRYIRATAIWLSGLIGLLLIMTSSDLGRDFRAAALLAALLLGGFFAWLTRDIAAAFERLRG
jgi:hypothetical protein